MNAEGTQPSPELQKRVEKEIAKEDKAEASRVKHILDNLANAEKAQAKAEKDQSKAEKILGKAEQKESKATKAASKATHERDIAVADVRHAEEEEQRRKQQAVKAQNDLQSKKAAAEAALKDQDLHRQERGEKIAQLKGQDLPGVDPV